jgi:hypothetical protein
MDWQFLIQTPSKAKHAMIGLHELSKGPLSGIANRR